MIATSLGFVLAFLLGSACRFFDIPLPAPPTWGGAILILVLTAGYVMGSAFHFTF
jgi:XapX domain-containing protein